MSTEVKGQEHLVRRQAAMMAVFRRFATVWRRAFHANEWTNLLDTWLDACRGIDTDVLELAAKTFLRGPPANYPPKPWEFAKVARRMHDQQRAESPDVVNARVAPEDDTPLRGAREFWFLREIAGAPFVAQAWSLANGTGCVGIADVEMRRLCAGLVQWRWGAYPHAPAAATEAR